MQSLAPSNQMASMHQSAAPNWREALDMAVQRIDEHTIWQIMDSQQDNEEAHEALTNMVSRMAYAFKSRNYFCEIFMMPVIADPECDVIGNVKAWKSISTTAKEAIQEWFTKVNQVTVFDTLAPLDWVTVWTPKILRSYLQRMIPGNENTVLQFLSEDIDLPPEAPRLGFLVLACRRENAWPEKPAANTTNEQRLKQVTRFALQIAAPSSGNQLPAAPIVLPVERAQFAITDGICAWLERLDDVVGLASYNVVQSKTAIDVVKITLRLESEAVPITQFALRLHQIGLQGLQDILTVLQQLAPVGEVPNDMTAQQAAEKLMG